MRRVNHTGVSVNDMERSLAFYVDVLGMEQVFESEVADRADIDATVGMADVRARLAFLDAGDTRLELWQYARPVGRPLRTGHCAADIGLSHVAFAVDDVDEVHARVVAAGYEVTTAPVDLGIHKTFYAYGPDGEIVEILEDRGSTRHHLAGIMASRRPEVAAGQPGGASTGGAGTGG